MAQGGDGWPGTEAALVTSLRARDEAVYDALVRRYTPLMLFLARHHVSSDAVAEEVVQDTWASVLGAIDTFDGRARFRTWLLRILHNTSITRGRQEARSTAMSSVPGECGRWDRHLEPVREAPDVVILRSETYSLIGAALGDLPPRQRAVFVLRDIDGLSAPEVCDHLGIASGNQRVLLHRARGRLREALVAADHGP